jgi:glycosyltransferase involved in cell wall biosynthesis
MFFSLIIPCFNEAKNIPLILERCSGLSYKNEIEVILVDNGSSDETKNVLKTFLPLYPNCRMISVDQNEGYGYGILQGLYAAKGDFLGWTHADMQTDPQDVLKVLELFEKNANIFIKGKRYGRPFFDTVFTIGMSIFETILLGCRMWDINAQPTMFSRKFFQTWTSPPKDFSLDLYAYYQAKIQDLNIFRFPVRFGERAYGVSHWNISFSAKLKFIRRTLSYSFQLKRNI